MLLSASPPAYAEATADPVNGTCRPRLQTPALVTSDAREQVMEGMRMSMGVRLAAAEHYLSQGRPALSNREAGVAHHVSSQFIRSARILPPDGRVELTFGCDAVEEIQGSKISLRPYRKRGAIHFECLLITRFRFDVPNCRPAW